MCEVPDMSASVLATGAINTDFSARGPLLSLAAHAVALIALMVPTGHAPLDWMVVTVPSNSATPTSVIYLHGRFPSMSDKSGAEHGREGRSGGSSVIAQQSLRSAQDGPAKSLVATVAIHVPSSPESPSTLVGIAGLKAEDTAVLLRTLALASPHIPMQEPPVPLKVRPTARQQMQAAEGDPSLFALQVTQELPRLPLLSGSSAQVATVIRPKLTAPVQPPIGDGELFKLASSATPMRNVPVRLSPGVAHVVLEQPIRPARTGKEVGPPSPQLALDQLRSLTDAAAVVGNVLSTTNGTHIVRVEPSRGSLSMTREGGRFIGAGDHGSGTGTRSGAAEGSGSDGSESSPNGTSGSGRGTTDLNAGSSPAGSSSGAGGGSTASRGVLIAGSTFYLSSFDAKPTSLPSLISSTVMAKTIAGAPKIVVVGGANTGGGVSADLAPSGTRIYSVYLATPIGTAVLQYAERGHGRGFQDDLTAPRVISTDLPSTLTAISAVVACIMDSSGALTDLRIVKADDHRAAEALLHEVSGWRFSPALRRNSPVSLNAVIAFGTDIH